MAQAQAHGGLAVLRCNMRGMWSWSHRLLPAAEAAAAGQQAAAGCGCSLLQADELRVLRLRV